VRHAHADCVRAGARAGRAPRLRRGKPMAALAPDPAAFRALEHAGWQRAARHYDDAFGSLTRQAVDPLLDSAEVRSGARTLDVASGPGYAAAEAAARGARVAALDFSSAMVELARSQKLSTDVMPLAASLLHNTSHKDITAYSITLTEKFADGTTHTSERSTDLLELALGGGGGFPAGTSRDEILPETNPVTDVVATLDVVAYSDGTADVLNQRAFKNLVGMRKANAAAAQKISDVATQAPTVEAAKAER